MGMPVAPTFVFPTNGFRFRDNVPDPASADAAFDAGDAAAGTDLTLDYDTLMRVRILLQQTNAAAESHGDQAQEFNIEYRINTGGGFGGWTAIGAIGTTAEAVIFAAGTPTDQAALATQRLGAGTFADGIYMESDPSTTDAVNFPDLSAEEAEIEVCFEVISEIANAADIIELRAQFVTAPSTTPTWNDDPSITVTVPAASGDVAATLPSLSAAATGQVEPEGDAIATLPALTAAAEGSSVDGLEIRAISDNSGNAGTAMTGLRPIGTLDGDHLIAFINMSAASGAISARPSGWAQEVVEGSPNDFQMLLEGKAASGEPASWEWTANETVNWRVTVVAIANTDGKDVGYYEDSGATTQSALAVGAMTTLTDNALVLTLTSVDASGGARTWTADGSPTEELDSMLEQHHAAIYSEVLATAGSITRTVTVSGTVQHMAAFMIAFKPISAANGDAAATLPSLTAAADADHIVDGDAAATLPMLTAAAVGWEVPDGDATATLPALAAAADADHIVDGDAAATLPSLTTAADADQIIDGDATTSLPSLTTAAIGWEVPEGDAASTLPSLTAAADADHIVDGDATATLPMLTAAADGDAGVVPEGDAVATLPALTAAADADHIVDGDAATTLPALTAAADGISGLFEGDAAATLPSLTTAADADHIVDGDATATLPALSAAAIGWEVPEGDAAATLPSLTAAADADHIIDGDAATTLPSLTTAADGTSGLFEGDAAATLPSLTTAADGWMVPDGDAAATLPSLVSAADADQIVDGDGTATLPALTAAADADHIVDGDGTATLPSLIAAAAADQIIDGDATTTLPALTAVAIGWMVPEGDSVASLPSLSTAADGTAGVIPVGNAVSTLPSLNAAAVATAAVLVAIDEYGNTLWGIAVPEEFDPSGFQAPDRPLGPPSGYDAGNDSNNPWNMR